MIKLDTFIKSLKICWIRRLICGSDTQWIKLFNEIYGIKKEVYFENMWFDVLKKRMTNGFWFEVINCWQEFSKKCKFKSNSDILNSCIWYNQKLTREPLYLPSWYKHGIYCVGDIVDSGGKIQSIDQLKNIYGLNVNVLDYYRVKLSVQGLIKKNKFDDNFNYKRPVHPFHLKVLMKSKKGCRDFYDVLISDSTKEPNAKIKWETLVDLTASNFWNVI